MPLFPFALKRIVNTTMSAVQTRFGIGLLITLVAAGAVLIGPTDKAGAKRRTTAPAPPPSPPAGSVTYHFDNDGKADVGRWDASNTEFRVKKSNGGSDAVFTLGSSSAIAPPGDFNNDGVTNACVFDAGTWTYKTSPTASAQTIPYGLSGDIPFVGNYDGDAYTDVGVFRPSTNYWYVYHSGDTKTYSYSFTQSGDIPTVGDYDGDGKTDVAAFRPSNGTWYILESGNGYAMHSTQFGANGDIPLQGEFDGDSTSDLTVYRPSTGQWWVLKSSDSTYYAVTWGSYGDQPVPADYDDDGKTDMAVWRPTTGVWLIIKSTDSTYDYKTLGIAGDQAIEAAYTKQIAASVAGNEMGPLRLKPTNATGGTNLYSQNFGWGRSLFNLPGRSSLDAGFGISYNSLVWIKSGSNMYFDPNAGNVSPGFRFGFPSIDASYYDSTKSKWTYLMVTPDGGRKEFRQIGASATFESADSSYTLLIVDSDGDIDPNAPPENVKMTVWTTDGTKMRYEWMAGGFRCTRITDRNGNYIKMAYHPDFGHLLTVTDTLGRVITVSYDTQLYPTAISQTWNTNNGVGTGTTTHNWASFTYTTQTVSTSFSGVTNYGPPNGTVIKVLDKITYADGSSTRFSYNGYVQVYEVDNYAADNHKLNHVWTNLYSPSSGQTDCPRFTQTKTYAENFNGGSQVTVDNTAPASSSFTGGNGSESTSMVRVTVDDHPTSDFNTMIHYAPSGYKEGLTIATEDCLSLTNCTGTNRVRWTWNEWTQDNTGVSYITNPRVTQSRVGDGTNTKKTTIEYYSSGGTYPYGLPEKITVGDVNNVLKTEKTIYNLSSNYTSRRIIGLPSEKYLYEGTDTAGTLMSKVTYTYDDYTTVALTDLTSPTQQCRTTSSDCPSAYGTSFTYRGNVTKIKRWDITYPTNDSLTVASQTAYNIAGSPVSTKDPHLRETTISYTDDWNDSVSRTTYAYPTTVTDPGGFSSTIEYRFDFGANVEANSPTPQGAGDGKNTSRTFDDTKGRLIKETIDNTGAYTEYEYNDNGSEMTTYTTVVDVGTSGVGSEDEVATWAKTDGAGRVIKSKTENPDSTGGYTGKQIIYDILGRGTGESVPTEMSTSWTTAAGDDASRGWVWNYKEYDWKGRVTRTIPSDSTGSDYKDTLISYAGCGCAGGQVTTISGPQADAIDMGGSTITTGKRKTQKIIEDILGRVVSKEIRSLDGTNLYANTVTEYNGRDQPTLIREYGASPSPTPYQDTTFDYDGHGRLSTLHKPEWYGTSTGDPKVTATTYNADDTISTVTDPRGAVVTYTYGNPNLTEKRPLVTKIEYSSPNTTTIPDPDDVLFTYDPAGNRASMSDGTGVLTYTYDELSRLTMESKNFDGTFTYEPPGGVFNLTYEYHLGGGLKSIEDPFDHITTYSADKIGRMTQIGAAGDVPSVSTTAYVSGINYRAFGAVKSMSMSTTAATSIAMTYDNALRPLTYEADNSTTGSGYVHKTSYTYLNDGALKEIGNVADPNFNQKNEYDFAARLKKNDVGQTGGSHPLIQAMGYDAFSNLTERSNSIWGSFSDAFTATYANNRKTGGGISYDYAGNVVYTSSSGGEASGTRGYTDIKHWKYDAAGHMTYWDEHGPWQDMTRSEDIVYDGDGRVGKKDDAENNTTWYYVVSSVTGQKITDLSPDGSFANTHIYMGGSLIAEYLLDDIIYFKTTDPISGSMRQMNADGTAPNSDETRFEMAGLGSNVPITAPQNFPEPPRNGGFVGLSESGCQINYGWVHCSEQERYLKRLGIPVHDGTIYSLWYYRKFLITPDRIPGIPDDDDTHLVETWYEIHTTQLPGGDKLKLETDEVRRLRRNVNLLMQDDTCRQFIERLYDTANQLNAPRTEMWSDDVMGMFDTIASQGGFTFGDTIKKRYGFSGSTIKGSFKEKTAGIEFDETFPLRHKVPIKGELSQRAADRMNGDLGHQMALTAVHEMAHLAGFNDGQLARAVATMNDDENYLENGPAGSTVQQQITNESIYWTKALDEKCGLWAFSQR